MSDDEVDLGMTEKQVEDDLVKRKIQTEGRVDIPDTWLAFLGLEEHGRVMLVLEEDGIVVKEWTRDNLKDL